MTLPVVRQRGFTLLEMLLVTMLIGVVATAVTLSMGAPRGDRYLAQQAQRFVATLQLAQEQAVMDGALLGLRIDDQSWQFMARNPQGSHWQAISDNRPLEPVSLPEDIALLLTLDGFIWSQSPPLQPKQRQGETVITPQILLFPGGELTPFTLTFTLQDDGKVYRLIVKGDDLGRVVLQQGDELDEERGR